MKTKLLLSLGVVFSFLFSVQAENTITAKLESLVTVGTDGEEIAKEEFIWNEENLLEKHTASGVVVNWGTPSFVTTTIDYVYNLGQATQVTTEKETITEVISWETGEPETQIQTQISRVNYGYDDLGRVNEVINSQKYGADWSMGDRVVTTRDSDGLLVDSTSYYVPWGSESDELEWEVAEKVILQYDEEKLLESLETWMPSSETGGLVLYTKATYEYETVEGQTIRTGTSLFYTDHAMELLEEPTNNWVEIVTFDATGAIISFEYNTWADWSGGWYGAEKYTVVRVPGVMGNYTETRTSYTWQSATSDWAVSSIIEEVAGGNWGMRSITRTEKVPNPEYDPEVDGSNEFIEAKKEQLNYGLTGSIMSKKTSVWTNGVEVTEGEVYAIDEETPIEDVIIPAFYTQAPYSFTYKPTIISISESPSFGSLDSTPIATVTFNYTELEGEVAIATVRANNAVQAYFAEGTLKVETPQSETVSVYSISGNLVYTANKAEGTASFDLALTQGIYIVKGSTGWAVKALLK